MEPAHEPDHVVSGYRSWTEADQQWLATWICERGPAVDDRQTLLPHAEVSLVACRRGDEIVARIFGPARQARSYAPDPDIILYAVTLAPEVLPDLTGLHANDLVDQSVCLRRADEAALEPVFDLLRNRSGLAALAHWRQAVQTWTRARRREDDPTHRIAAQIRRRKGQVRIAELCAQTGLSERQIRRNLIDATGLSPKQYARQQRLQHLVALADAAEPENWADLAYAAGYCDQSHLNRECRALTGLSPVELHRARHGMSEKSKTLPTPI